ncbi:hypothetical protein BCR32DRAFT_285879 [Anaeromyces robustus]|uniref:Uncharacterized protein n=1 Tax=Anaeromyces robustus TaxID=1754192 RepID=A0A1Y1WCD3_9FUNG|nr:hypothetical protein BCR32DRAFT_285879 [Anaeromyces robustus]|eukprot:ORX71035.1 hypothetical protein BCR32DRAFT_285879 [Anaeromyces robustus]
MGSNSIPFVEWESFIHRTPEGIKHCKFGCYAFNWTLYSAIICGKLRIMRNSNAWESFQALLSRVHDWAKTNGITFGINKCATMVVKPLKLFLSHN